MWQRPLRRRVRALVLAIYGRSLLLIVDHHGRLALQIPVIWLLLLLLVLPLLAELVEGGRVCHVFVSACDHHVRAGWQTSALRRDFLKLSVEAGLSWHSESHTTTVFRRTTAVVLEPLLLHFGVVALTGPARLLVPQRQAGKVLLMILTCGDKGILAWLKMLRLGHLLWVIITYPLDKLSLRMMHSSLLLWIIRLHYQITLAVLLMLPLSGDLLLVHHRLHVSDAHAARICGRLWEVAKCATHYLFLFGHWILLHVGEKSALTLATSWSTMRQFRLWANSALQWVIDAYLLVLNVLLHRGWNSHFLFQYGVATPYCRCVSEPLIALKWFLSLMLHHTASIAVIHASVSNGSIVCIRH